MPIIGQVWRDGRRQGMVARLIAATNVEAPAERDARRAGELLARSKTRDIVDALLAGTVRNGDTVLTSGPDDIELLVARAGVQATVERV